MTGYALDQFDLCECHSFAGLQMLRTCLCRLNRWEFSDLSAPFWRWYANRTSGAFLVVNKKRIPLAPGRIHLIPPYTIFATGNDRPVEHLYMHFTLALKHAPLGSRVFSHRITPSEAALSKSLIAALKRGADWETSFLSQALANIALGKLPADCWEDRPPDPLIERALQRIHAAAPRALGNERLARKLGINANALTRRFRAATGHTPHQYLMRLRLEKASQLLQHGTASIDAVAEQSGFCDRYHLSRVFKRHFHTGPGAFRRRSRGTG